MLGKGEGKQKAGFVTKEDGTTGILTLAKCIACYLALMKKARAVKQHEYCPMACWINNLKTLYCGEHSTGW